MEKLKEILSVLRGSSSTKYQVLNYARDMNIDVSQEVDFGRQKRIVICEVLQHILQEDESKYYQDLLNETKQFLNLKKRVGYFCCFSGCQFNENKHKSYLRHLRSCHFLSKDLLCNFRRRNSRRGCQQRFPSIEALEDHVSEVHQNKEVEAQEVSGSGSSQRISNVGLICRCTLQSCGKKTFPNLKLLMLHFNSKQHKNETRTCIFDGCQKELGPESIGRHHFNYQHTQKSCLKLKPENIVVESSIVVDNSMENVANPGYENEENNEDEDMLPVDDSFDEDQATDDIDVEKENFYKSFADFLNRLSYIKMIPQSTIDIIIEGFLKLSLKAKEIRIAKLRRFLDSKHLSNEIQSKIYNILEEDEIIEAQKMLNTRHRRENFIKENFKMVEAKEILLNEQEVKNEGKPKDSFFYVPILDSMRALFEDQTFLHILEKSQSSPRDPEDEDLLVEIRDGSLIRSLPYFKKFPEAYLGLLYSDEVEIVSPLGAGRGRHKVLQLFWTIGDIPKKYRSQVDTIQLGIVVKSNLIRKYGYRKIYKQLISDLNILEREGILVKHPFVRRIRVSFALHIGDNLEAANLGKGSLH